MNGFQQEKGNQAGDIAGKIQHLRIGGGTDEIEAEQQEQEQQERAGSRPEESVIEA
ncbi:hypothetical protein D3C87_2122210 [compost metagenome]